MADITETLARIVNTQADEIARLRKINDGLVADGREQAATIRTLIDQRGALVGVASEMAIGKRLQEYWWKPGVSIEGIAKRLNLNTGTVSEIIDGHVEPLGTLRQRIEALIGGEVAND